ncbi:MAG: hypothetical protein ACOVMT_04215 [Caulobacter sp.]|jgi:hypothetical protein
MPANSQNLAIMERRFGRKMGGVAKITLTVEALSILMDDARDSGRGDGIATTIEGVLDGLITGLKR